MKINPKTKLFTNLTPEDKTYLIKLARKLTEDEDVSAKDIVTIKTWYDKCKLVPHQIPIGYGSVMPYKILESIMKSTCKWTEDSDGMMSGCGKLFPYDNGLPTDAKHCPYCGAIVKLPAAYSHLD